MNIAGNLSRGVAKLARCTPMGTWVEHAACAGLNPELFHPERGESTRPAKSVCAACAVRTDCLHWALETRQQHGIWGGLSERERKRHRATPPAGVVLGRRTCECCGDEFSGRRADQRFCTADCRRYALAAAKRRAR